MSFSFFPKWSAPFKMHYNRTANILQLISVAFCFIIWSNYPAHIKKSSMPYKKYPPHERDGLFLCMAEGAVSRSQPSMPSSVFGQVNSEWELPLAIAACPACRYLAPAARESIYLALQVMVPTHRGVALLIAPVKYHLLWNLSRIISKIWSKFRNC